MSANDLPVRMFQMASAKLVTKPLYVAAKLGIADLLAGGARHVDDLAAVTHAHAPSLYRVLRVLASVGVFTETDPHTFALTPLAEFLRDDPRSMRNMILWLNDPRHDHMWESFLHTVQTGETVVQKTYGSPVWEYLGRTPDLAAIFHAAMANNANNMHAAAIQAYDFSRLKKLVDVGGGHGALLARILTENSALEGVVFDLPHVVEGARAHLQASKLGARAQAIGGDFFERVPEGDAHIMSFIVHDWDDERATQIFANIHRAQPEGGMLLLVEMVIPVGNEPSFGKVIDMEMLGVAGGRERTAEEYRAVLAAGGYRLTRVVATPSPASVIEAVRV